MSGASKRSADFVLWIWGDTGCIAKEFYQAIALRLSRSLPEKFGSRFHNSDLFRDVYSAFSCLNHWRVLQADWRARLVPLPVPRI